MSRGPGRWQRAILEALQTRDWIGEWHVFPRDCGHTQRFVFRRAAERLAEQGLVTVERLNHEFYVTRRQNSAKVSHLDTAEVSVTYVQNSGDVSHLGEEDGHG